MKIPLRNEFIALRLVPLGSFRVLKISDSKNPNQSNKKIDVRFVIRFLRPEKIQTEYEMTSKI